MELLDLKRKTDSKSLQINKTIERAKIIEERRRNKILQKEQEREEKLKERQNRQIGNLTAQKEHYRQAVKLQNQFLEDHRRSRYLEKLQQKEEKFRLSQSRRDEDMQKKLHSLNNSKLHKVNYQKRFEELKQQEKEDKLRRLQAKDEYIHQINFEKKEEDRLRSMIQVKNKFRTNSDINELSPAKHSHLASNASFILGTSTYASRTPAKTKSTNDSHTVDYRR